MTARPTLRQLAASSAVALAFAAANGNAAGLIDDNDAVNRYRPAMSIALAKATGNDEARLRASGFMVGFEAVLAGKPVAENFQVIGNETGTRILVYPKENSTNMLVVAAVVPPKGTENVLPAAVVCAQQNNRPLAAWTITQKGELLSRPVVLNPEGSTKAACNATIAAAREEFAQKLAQQSNPPPQGAPPGRVSEAKPAAVVAVNLTSTLH